MENEGHAEETVQLEDRREAGPRWAQLEGEAVRNQRGDAVTYWCRRVAGLIVWCFVTFIFSQLWTVAWQMKNLKLLGVCMLVTASLFYVFIKRYQQIRDSGLSGVELIRALAVDDTGATRLRGISRKARALCLDFKYDPEGTFRERSPGCGFELYPPPLAPPPPDDGDSSRPASTADGEEKGKDEEGKGPSSWRRRRVRWPWGLRAGAGRGIGVGGEATSSGQGGTATEADEETPITRQERDDADGEQPAPARPSAPPPPDLEVGGGGGGQVIRASELSLSCSVCLFEYYKNEAVTLLPCSHLYHTECIDIWMRDHTDCPYCRADMNSWSITGGGGSGSVNRASLGAATAGAGGGSGVNSSPAPANAAAAAAASAVAAPSPGAAAPAVATVVAGGAPS